MLAGDPMSDLPAERTRGAESFSKSGDPDGLWS
jgi:hypothetical protein